MKYENDPLASSDCFNAAGCGFLRVARTEEALTYKIGFSVKMVQNGAGIIPKAVSCVDTNCIRIWGSVGNKAPSLRDFGPTNCSAKFTRLFEICLISRTDMDLGYFQDL